MKVKPLIWKSGEPNKFNNNQPGFDVAVTPFGEYKAWYSDGELWGPTPESCFLGRHDTADKAKEVAYAHLCAGIAELIEE